MNNIEFKSTFDKIDYDIQMRLYQEFNDKIAAINDHLGEMYDYRDLKEAEDCEKHYELKYYKEALKEKCDSLDNLIKYLEDNIERCEQDDEDNYITQTYEEILEKVKSDKYD